MKASRILDSGVTQGFWQVIDSENQRKWWTFAETKDGPFICSAQGRIISQNGSLWKRITAAVEAAKAKEKEAGDFSGSCK